MSRKASLLQPELCLGLPGVLGPLPTVGVGVGSLLVGHDPGRGVVDLPREREREGEGSLGAPGAMGRPVLPCTSPRPPRRGGWAGREGLGHPGGGGGQPLPPLPGLLSRASSPGRAGSLGRRHSQHGLLPGLAPDLGPQLWRYVRTHWLLTFPWQFHKPSPSLSLATQGHRRSCRRPLLKALSGRLQEPPPRRSLARVAVGRGPPAAGTELSARRPYPGGQSFPRGPCAHGDTVRQGQAGATGVGATLQTAEPRGLGGVVEGGGDPRRRKQEQSGGWKKKRGPVCRPLWPWVPPGAGPEPGQGQCLQCFPLWGPSP